MVVLLKPSKFWKLHLSFVEFHKKYAEYNLLFDYNKKIKRCVDLLTKILIPSFLLCIIYPIIALVIQKKKVLCFSFVLPFIDVNTNFGYSVNYLYQSSQVVVATIGYMTFFRIFWLLFGNALVRVDLLKEFLDELKDTDDDATITRKIKEIIDLHLEYMRFEIPTGLPIFFKFLFLFSSIESIEEVGSTPIFTLAVSTVMQVSIVLLVLSIEMWYPGISVIIVATATLLSVCTLGTILEIKYDQFNAALYTTPWYMMSLKHQKEILVILMASQKKKPITFGNLAEVTVSSFLEVHIFTYFH